MNRALMIDQTTEMEEPHSQPRSVAPYASTLPRSFPYYINVALPLAMSIGAELVARGGGHCITSEAYDIDGGPARRVYFSEFSRSFVEAEIQCWERAQEQRRLGR